MIMLNHMIRFIRRYFLFILIFLLIIFGIFIGFFYSNSIFYKNSAQITDSQAASIIEKVGKLAFLPEDETPTIATVSDPALLANQPFFAEAKKGDQVLIYTSARKAILYDPVANKIVNMATLNIGGVNKPAQALPGLQNKEFKNTNSANEIQF